MASKRSINPPEPLRGQELGTFTHYSIVERLPEIGRRTLAENDFPEPIGRQLKRLIGEIPEAELTTFSDPGAPDIQDWHSYLQQHQDQNWLQAPWFLVETYFYRRIIALTGYFDGGTEPWRDPFQYQKRASLEKMVSAFEPQNLEAPLEQMLSAALWGNQADLSLWPEGNEKVDRQAPSPDEDRVLVDHRVAVSEYVAESRSNISRIDLVLDNAGEELVADLLLAAKFSSLVPGVELHLHAKAHPTFVSDATSADVLDSLHQLQLKGTSPARQLARRLLSDLGAGAVTLNSHLYWTSPLPGWSMPSDLMEDLAQSDLLIFKGDANYRRMLGDRHWPFDFSLDTALHYLPVPTLLIRALKSEIAVGLDKNAMERAQQKDEDWMTDGNWGLIQFRNPFSS